MTVGVVGHIHPIHEVVLRRVRLVLGWVTLLCNQPPLGPTQPPILSGTEMSTGQGAVAVLLAWEGNRMSSIAPATRPDWYIHL